MTHSWSPATQLDTDSGSRARSARLRNLCSLSFAHQMKQAFFTRRGREVQECDLSKIAE